jgi:hypothetical protein
MFRADSGNLPVVDIQMFSEFISNSELFSKAEFRYGKLKK